MNEEEMEMADALEQGGTEQGLADIARDMENERNAHDHWVHQMEFAVYYPREAMDYTTIHPDRYFLEANTHIGAMGITRLMALVNGYSTEGGFYGGLCKGGEILVRERGISETTLENSRSAEMLKLLDGGEDIHAQDARGMNALHHAARNLFSGTAASCLIDSGAEVDAQDSEGRTAMHHLAVSTVAARNGRLQAYRRPDTAIASTMKSLLDKQANVNIADEDGNTPLHLAMEAGDGAMIKALIAAGANVNAVNKEGKTPMHKGAEKNISGEGIKLLLAAKADPNIQDGEGNVALHYLAEHAYDGTRHWGSLAEAGANIHIKNKAGVSCHDAIVTHRQAERERRGMMNPSTAKESRFGFFGR